MNNSNFNTNIDDYNIEDLLNLLELNDPTKEDKKYYKIYSDNNYNRFIYTSTKHINKSQFTREEENNIKKLEKLLFKSRNHCKRGQGIQRLPKHININNNNNKFNYKEFLNSIYNRWFIK